MRPLVVGALKFVLIISILFLPFVGFSQITEEDFFKIEESIVIAATKQKQTVSEAPATVYAIDQKTLRILGFSELNQVLRFIRVLMFMIQTSSYLEDKEGLLEHLILH